jgi:integrase
MEGDFMPKRNASLLTKRLIESAATNRTIWDVQIPGFGVRTTEKGYRSFIFQYRSRAGGQGKIVIGRFPSMTVEEARKIARQHRINVDGGGNPSSERKAVRSAPTMGDMIDYYTGEYAKNRALKPQTAAEMRRLLDRFVRPTLGKRKVAEVQPTDIRRVHGAVKDAVSPYRANKVLAGLSRIFNLSVADEIRPNNPCFGITKYPEDRRTKHLGHAEVVRLLNACDHYEDKQAANVLRLLLLTGARFREVLHATWDQFDLDKGLWVKPSHHTKTKIVHEVRLGDQVVAVLRGMEGEKIARYLFPGRTLEAPRTDLKRPWRAIQDDAGLAGYRIHDLRRTYASFLLNTGSDLSVVGKALGHTQPSTTQRYASLFTETERDAANRAVSALMPLRVVG